MADTVEQAIYRLRVEGKESVDALDGAAAKLAATEDRLTVSEERVTRATRTRSDSMDRLLGRLDPRVRAEQQLQAALAQINRFEEEGIGSIQQRAMATDAATQRYADAMQRIKGTKAEGTFLGAANAMKLSTFQMQNMAFQMNDIGVMLASGQSPFVLLMQQGMQIAQIFGPGVGVAAAMKATGAALISFITNPLTLTVIAIAAVAGATSLLFKLISGSSGESAADALKRHKDLIDEIAKAYGKGGEAARAFGLIEEDVLKSTALLHQIQMLVEMRTAAKNLTAEFQSLVRINFFGLASVGLKNPFADWKVPQGFIDDARKFRVEFAAGTTTAEAYRKRLGQLGQAFPTRENLTFIDSEIKATQAAFDLEQAQKKLAAQMAVAAGTATAEQQALVDAEKAMERLTARTKEAADQFAYMTKNASALVDVEREHAAAMAAIGARSPYEKAAAARAAVLAQPIDPNESTALRLLKAENAAALALAGALHTLSEAQRDRKRALEESVRAAELDLQVIGKSIGEVARLRMEYGLLAKLREDAAKNGIAVDPAEIASASATAAIVGQLTQQRAEQEKINELLFEQDQIFRSTTEQAVASALHELYGDEWQAHIDEAIAKQIRFNALLKDLVGPLKSALEGVFTGAIKDADQLLDSITKGFADIAAKRAVDNLAAVFDKLGVSIKGASAALGGFGIGYSTGSPGIGAVGGALAGLSFGPIGAIVGGIAGLLGGLFGKSSKEKQQEREQKQAEAATKLANAENALRAAYEARAAAIRDRVLTAENDLRAAYEARSAALEDTISRMKDFIAGIKEFKESLLLDQSVSTFNPQQRLAEAQRQFEATAALAKRGDAGAQADLTTAARTYLDEARSFFASSVDYAAIFDQVNATLDDAAVGAEARLTVAERQLASLNTQVGKLIDIDDSVKTVARAIRDLHAAQKVERQFAVVTRQVEKLIDIDQSVKSVGVAMRQLLAVIAQQGGKVGTARQAGGMIPRYAGGGVIGNGTFDVDSVRARYERGGDVMLAGGEFVNRATSVTPQTLPVLDYINRTGTPPANDNGAYFAALGAMLTRAMGATTSAQIAAMREEMDQLRQEVRRLNDTWRTEARRPPRPGTKSAAA